MIEAVKSKSDARSITTQCRNIAASQVFTPRREARPLYCNLAAIGGIVGLPPRPQAYSMNISDKRRAFRALHQSGCFVIPNPWNVGSARYLQGLGFKALATTSAGYAHSIGYSDGDVTRDMVLAHCREIAHATEVPVNADFEGGYAD